MRRNGLKDNSSDVHVAVVQREGVGQLSVNAEHARRSNRALVLEISVHQGSQIEAAKVPDSVEKIVNCASNRVISAQDCTGKRQKAVRWVHWVAGYLRSKKLIVVVCESDWALTSVISPSTISKFVSFARSVEEFDLLISNFILLIIKNPSIFLTI